MSGRRRAGRRLRPRPARRSTFARGSGQIFPPRPAGRLNTNPYDVLTGASALREGAPGQERQAFFRSEGFQRQRVTLNRHSAEQAHYIVICGRASARYRQAAAARKRERQRPVTRVCEAPFPL